MAVDAGDDGSIGQGVARSDRVRQLGDAAQALGVPLREAASQSLMGYLALVQHWNRVYNLTAVREPGQMLVQHLSDCLALVPPLRRVAGGRTLRVLDVGSGGGLPGVVLAILQPDWSVTCVDAVAKKASFIRQVGAELGLTNLQAVHARVEDMPARKGEAPGYDIVTSRAFASLLQFTTLTRQHLAPDGVWVAMKGHPPDDEMAALSPETTVFHVEPLQVPGLQAQRCLVWMRPTAA